MGERVYSQERQMVEDAPAQQEARAENINFG